MATVPTPPSSRRGLWISIGLVAATLVVYGQTATSEFDFLHVDDPDYVTDNPHVQQGITLDSLNWAFTALHANNWHPLTWMSLQLDYQLFGLEPRTFHLANALLHAANSVLLFWLLRRMTGAVWRSAAVAAFFALHPTHVESVAWITERKDVLSALFWLLTTLAYVWYAERPGAGRYVLTVLAFVFGMAAKPMLVTLPATLLLLDYWPLRRWQLGEPVETEFARTSIGRLVLEKLPLFAIVVATIPITIRAQAGVAKSLDVFPLHVRVENALVAYVQYIVMLFRPVDLAIFYPHSGDTISVWKPIAAGVLLVALTVTAVWVGRRRPYLIVGWLWYLGTLVPVIGLIQVGMQALADRYTYIPYIGLFIIIAWGIADVTAAWDTRARPLAAAAALVLAVWGLLSFLQVRHWRNTTTLWQRALDVMPDNATAHEGLGVELARDGRLEEARTHLREAIRLGRHRVLTHGTLAGVLEGLGDLDGAAEQYLIVLRHIDPDSAANHFGLGRVRAAQGRFDEAETHFRAALRIEPRAEGHAALGEVLEARGKLGEAQEQFEAALRAEPESPAAHCDLARLLNRRGRSGEALALCDAALKLQPDFAPANNQKGLILEGQCKLPEAVAAYRRAVALAPRQWIFHCNLAHALHESGQTEEAAGQYREALRLQPDWPRQLLEQAWLRATARDARMRNGPQALRLAKQVAEATRSRYLQALDVLAAAYAELGRFDDAVAAERRLLDAAPPNTPPDLLKEFRDRLKLYEDRKPYRQP